MNLPKINPICFKNKNTQENLPSATFHNVGYSPDFETCLNKDIEPLSFEVCNIIRTHFRSYKFPYNPDNRGDLESLCRGLKTEKGIIAKPEQYYNAVFDIKDTHTKNSKIKR